MWLDDRSLLTYLLSNLVDIKILFEAVEVGAVDRFHCLVHGLLALKLPKVQAKLFKSRDVTIHFNQSEALWDRRQDVASSRKLENLATHTMRVNQSRQMAKKHRLDALQR